MRARNIKPGFYNGLLAAGWLAVLEESDNPMIKKARNRIAI